MSIVIARSSSNENSARTHRFRIHKHVRWPAKQRDLYPELIIHLSLDGRKWSVVVITNLDLSSPIKKHIQIQLQNWLKEKWESYIFKHSGYWSSLLALSSYLTADTTACSQTLCQENRSIYLLQYIYLVPHEHQQFPKSVWNTGYICK